MESNSEKNQKNINNGPNYEKDHNYNNPPNSDDSLNPIHTYIGRRPPRDYSQIRTDYSRIVKKEYGIQIFSSIFIILSFIVDFIVFILVRRVLGNTDRTVLLRLTILFIILGLIALLAIIQFIMVTQWNSQARRPSGSLSQINYQWIERSKILRYLMGAIIFVCIWYFIINNRIQIPVNSAYPRLLRLYRALIRFSSFLVFTFLIIEVYQLVKWSKRIRKIKSIELTMINEIPGFDELTRLINEDQQT